MDQNLFNDICLAQLRLSGVHEGETVAVLTRGADRGEYADAFLWAAQQLGAATFHLRLPSPASASGAWAVGDSGLGDVPLAVEALKSVDMLVDCTFLLFSPEQFAIQDAGTRILTAVEPPELLARLMPTTELRERVEYGADLLAKAQSMRITSPAGTDVTYRLGVYPTLSEYGYTDTPGRWDHWPAAFVFTGQAPAQKAAVPARSPLTTRIRADYAEALKRASLERQLARVEPATVQEMLEEALGPWLKANGYLP